MTRDMRHRVGGFLICLGLALTTAMLGAFIIAELA